MHAKHAIIGGTTAYRHRRGADDQCKWPLSRHRAYLVTARAVPLDLAEPIPPLRLRLRVRSGQVKPGRVRSGHCADQRPCHRHRARGANDAAPAAAPNLYLAVVNWKMFLSRGRLPRQPLNQQRRRLSRQCNVRRLRRPESAGAISKSGSDGCSPLITA